MDFLGATGKFMHGISDADAHFYRANLTAMWNLWVEQLGCPADQVIKAIQNIEQAVLNSSSDKFEIRQGGYWLTLDEGLIRSSMQLLEQVYGPSTIR